MDKSQVRPNTRKASNRKKNAAKQIPALPGLSGCFFIFFSVVPVPFFDIPTDDTCFYLFIQLPDSDEVCYHIFSLWGRIG
jgi:hypothetical protein